MSQEQERSPRASGDTKFRSDVWLCFLATVISPYLNETQHRNAT